MDKTLFLVRGLPGSGKSTLARILAPSARYEADMYFEQTGAYLFDPSKLASAHAWCQEQTVAAMQRGHPVVAVANTFSQNWEMEVYKASARHYGYSVFVVHCENEFGNIHGCPTEAVQRMRQRWEPYRP